MDAGRSGCPAVGRPFGSAVRATVGPAVVDAGLTGRSTVRGSLGSAVRSAVRAAVRAAVVDTRGCLLYT
uniref:hypothetical protein n=1 Tax=Streptomyces sp. st170 TaxID=1828058 RepID=UPI0035A105EA